MQPESVALAELISYLEEMNCIDDSYSVFKLADLVKLYTERLAQLGCDTSKRIIWTRLKDKLLSPIPQLEAYKSNHEVVLSFKLDIGEALLCASQKSSDDDAVILKVFAQIVRKDLLQKQYQFKWPLIDES